MSWTDERIQELSRLWQAGFSASEIGKRLGVSKNAVVGKAHRLKLPSRPSPIKQGGAVNASEAAGGETASATTATEAPAPSSAAVEEKRADQQAAEAVAATPAPAASAAVSSVATASTESKARQQPSQTPAAKPTPQPKQHTGTAELARNGKVKATAPKSRKAAATKVQPTSLRAQVEARGGGSTGCLWPIGDPNDPEFHFCGAKPVSGKPYCAEHAARAYITKSRADREERDEEAA